MPVTQTSIEALKQQLTGIKDEAKHYFETVIALIEQQLGVDVEWRYRRDPAWGYVGEYERTVASSLQVRLKDIVLRVIEASRLSPLLEDADRSDLQIAYKEMSAALRMKVYSHWDTEVLHDEGTVLGVRRGGQEEQDISPKNAKASFESAIEKLSETLGMVVPSDAASANPTVLVGTAAMQKYHPNTAFIMMWISDNHPELDDVCDCIKGVFKEFGIAAVRSDDIEHQDTITERILHEIGTSEFLIADLSGERPSVYYEVGYAHALGKRPILYRKKGTQLHFDLAVHNVPEYENIVDLRNKLRKRLAVLMNRDAGTIVE
jgi:hypothetical protein